MNEVNNEYENIILESNLNGKSLLIDSIVLKEKYQNKKADTPFGVSLHFGNTVVL